MLCQTCRTIVDTDEYIGAHTGAYTETGLCPRCGSPLSLAPNEPPSAQSREVVPSVPPERGLRVSAASRALLDAVPRLTALAWEQPAVRSVVRTGASAVALSVAARVASRWMQRHGGHAAQQPGAALTTLTDLMAPRLHHDDQPRGQLVEVTETIIYLRRTIRF